MRLGIFAKTFPGDDAAAVLASVRAAGFSTTQFNMACVGLPALPDAVPGAVAAGIAAAAAAAGVSIAAVSGTFNMIHPDPSVRARGLARLRVLAAACPAMGTRLVTLCTGTRDPDDPWRHHPDNATPDAWRYLLDAIGTAIEIAQANDIALGIEPEPGNVVRSAEVARQLLDELRSDRLAIVLDPANLIEGSPAGAHLGLVDRAVGLLGDRIVMAHAKDRSASGDVVAAGTGVVDFGHLVRALAGAGFDGPLVAHGCTAAQAPGVARFLGRTLLEAGIAVP